MVAGLPTIMARHIPYIIRTGLAAQRCTFSLMPPSKTAAYWSGWWLQAHWSPTQSARSIVWKELYAIVMAKNTWDHHWNRKKILFHCNNHAVVDYLI